MIFVTVGTQFPFDRLVRGIDDAVGKDLVSDEVFAQTGQGGYVARNFKCAESLDKAEFENYMDRASAVISHAGMGTITAALKYNKPLLVLPRLKKYNEVVNDHQVAIARKFESLGHLLAAYSADELPEKIEKLKKFRPAERNVSPELAVNVIRNFLQENALV